MVFKILCAILTIQSYVCVFVCVTSQIKVEKGVQKPLKIQKLSWSLGASLELHLKIQWLTLQRDKVQLSTMKYTSLR